MNFVRKITHSDTLKHMVDLPESLRDQEVELIILPLLNSYSDKEQPSYVSGSSVRGMLRQYGRNDCDCMFNHSCYLFSNKKSKQMNAEAQSKRRVAHTELTRLYFGLRCSYC